CFSLYGLVPTAVFPLPLHDALPISHDRVGDVCGYIVVDLLWLAQGPWVQESGFSIRRRVIRQQVIKGCAEGVNIGAYIRVAAVRSEEHTSELQSRENLVCRLLLENK